MLAHQPVAAATHATENLNVAFELVQVRTGEGLKPMYRSGLVPQGTPEAGGIELSIYIVAGIEEKCKVKFANAWEEDGSARKEIRNFFA